MGFAPIAVYRGFFQGAASPEKQHKDSPQGLPVVRQLLRAFCAFWCLCENSLMGFQGGRFRFWLFVKCWGKSSKTTKLNEGVHSMKQGCVLLFLNSRMRDVQNTREKTRKITEAETNTHENFFGSLPKAGGKVKGLRGIKASQHKAGSARQNSAIAAVSKSRRPVIARAEKMPHSLNGLCGTGKQFTAARHSW